MKATKDNPKILDMYGIVTRTGIQTVTVVEFVPYKWTAAEFAELVEKKNQEIDRQAQ